MLPPLTASDRLLVIAPHCDDETLGPGGLAAKTHAAGGKVRVVLITNGDGFHRGAQELFSEARVPPVDYLRMGLDRQAETLTAMAELGVKAGDISFLGYPDAGTAAMWQTHWEVTQRYISPQTQEERPPRQTSHSAAGARPTALLHEVRMYDPRPPRPDELDDLEDLLATCFGFGPRRRERPRRPRRVPKGARIIALDGKPVSNIAVVYNTLSVHGARVKIASFGGVCTHPDYRNRGIATELLDYCFREAHDAGATLVLISGARGLYRRAHAEPAGAVWATVMQSRDVAGSPSAVTVRRAAAEDWPSLAAMHQAEPVRFVRTARFYQAMVSHGWHRHTWIIEHEGRPAAYASLAHDWDVPHGVQSRLLGEYAGSRGALLEGLGALFAAAELSQLKIAFPQFDRELAYLCRRRGIELTPRTIPSHTIRLLNLPALMKALRPYLVARLLPTEARALHFAQDDVGCRFGLGEETAELGLSQATALVLGGRYTPRLDGALGATLSRVFPIPMPLPGANYV